MILCKLFIDIEIILNVKIFLIHVKFI